MKRVLSFTLALLLIILSVFSMFSCDEQPAEPEIPDDGKTDDTIHVPPTYEPPAVTLESVVAYFQELLLAYNHPITLNLTFYSESVSVSQGVETATRTEIPARVTISYTKAEGGALNPHAWQAVITLPAEMTDGEEETFVAYYVEDTFYFTIEGEATLVVLSPEDAETLQSAYLDLAEAVHTFVASLPTSDHGYELLSPSLNQYILTKEKDSTEALEAMRAFLVSLSDMTLGEAIATYVFGNPNYDVASQPALMVEYLKGMTVEDLFLSIESLIAPLTLPEAVEMLKVQLKEEGEDIVATLEEVLAIRESAGARTLLSLIAEDMGIPEEEQTEEVMNIFTNTLTTILAEMLVHPIGDVPVMTETNANGSTTTTTYRQLVEPLALFTVRESRVEYLVDTIALKTSTIPFGGKVEYTLMAGADMELMPGHVASIAIGMRVGVVWTLEINGDRVTVPEGEIEILDPLF